MLIVGAAVALLTSPHLSRCVVLATDRRPDPRLMAAAASASALLIVWRAEDALHGAALSLVAAVGIVAGWIDVYERRLPDVLVLPAYPAVAALLLADADAETMLRAAACAAALAGLYLAGHLFGQVGFGDVKLAGLLGLVLGWASWRTVALAAAATLVIGGVQAAVVLALRRSEFPFGPAMLFGASAALVITNMGIAR